jgi:hypothetical protein
MERCVRFLEGKLKLKANRKKSAVGNLTKLKFLGFSFCEQRRGAGAWEGAEEAVGAVKGVGRKRSGAIEAMLVEAAVLLQGWLGCCSIADMKARLERLRRRIHWKRWKGARTRWESLMKLEVNRKQACQWENARKGCWRTAGRGMLNVALSDRYLEALGFPNLAKRYGETASQSQAASGAARSSLNRRVRNRAHSGVEGRLPNDSLLHD